MFLICNVWNIASWLLHCTINKHYWWLFFQHCIWCRLKFQNYLKIRIFQHRMLIHFNDYPITKCRIADILQYFSKGMHLSFIVSKPLCLEALKKLNSDLAWVVCCLLLCKHSLLYHCNMSSRGNFNLFLKQAACLSSWCSLELFIIVHIWTTQSLLITFKHLTMSTSQYQS